jgi:lipopolysaccharide transport system permease protein
MMPSAEVRVTGPLPAASGLILKRSWDERSLLGYFGRRFNEKRYLRTWLGAWWLLLRPGLTVAWQLFVFILIAPIDSGPVPFAVTFLVAFATWSFFAEAAFWATRSLELNRRALKIVAVSPIVVIVAALVPAMIDLAICAGFLVVTVLVYLVVDGQSYVVLSSASVSVVAGFLLLTMLALGIGLLLAVPGARFRDVRFGLRFVLGVWYFGTPVIYPVSAVPQGVRTLIEINPVTGAVELVRHGLLGTPGPSTLALASSCILALLVLMLGFRRFVRGHGKGLDHL